MDKIRVGILGAGRIAGVMADTMTKMDCVEICAVASRDLARSREMAQKFAIPKAYGSYGEMLADPAVQLVYIATPHSHHCTHIKACLDHGKHVLCEKAFTMTLREAEEAIRLAREKKLLLVEALWTRFQPFVKTIRDLIDGGIVGNVSMLTASLGADVKHKERIQRPELGGGALLDLGVYPLNFAYMMFGTDVTDITSSCIKYPTGVDAQICMALRFGSGRMASLFSTIMVNSDKKGTIYGDKGYMVVDSILNPDSVRVYGTDHRLREVRYREPVISGYEFEVEAVVGAIREGAVECGQMTHGETLRIMGQLDGLRRDWGVEFEF